jgi:hypothetical protein
VSYTVSRNPDITARERTLMVAAVPYKISQDGRQVCTYSISPEQQSFGDEGGTGEVQVTAGAECAWSTASAVPWLTIVAGGSGRGPGVVTYKAHSNDASQSRSGTLTIATRTLTVNQEGGGASQPANCEYAVAPVEFAPCMSGGRLTATVTTQPHCQWTAAAGVSWLSVPSGSSGAGSGAVTISFSDNYDAPRDGIIMVRWPTPTAGQNIRSNRRGAFIGLSQASFTVAAAGGPGSFNVCTRKSARHVRRPLAGSVRVDGEIRRLLDYRHDQHAPDRRQRGGLHGGCQRWVIPCGTRHGAGSGGDHHSVIPVSTERPSRRLPFP